MFKLLILYSIIYFCRTGEYIPFLGRVEFLGTIRHEMLVAVFTMAAVAASDVGRKNLAAAFSNSAWKTMSLLVFVAFLSIPFAVWRTHAFGAFVDFFKLYIFAAMIVACIRDEQQFHKYILLYIICIVYIAWAPLQNYLQGVYLTDLSGGVTTSRLASPIRFYKNPNVLAITLLQCLPFIYYRMAYSGFFRDKLRTGLMLAAAVLILLIVVQTGSRGGFLVLACLAFFISYRSKYRKFAFLMGMVAAVAMWSMMGEEFQARYSTITELGSSDKAASDRILGLQHGFEMMLENPLLGVGVGCYPIWRWQNYESALWAHNLPGQLMGELGLLGVIVFVLFIIRIFRNTREARRLLAAHGMQKSLLYYQLMALEASMFGQLINGIGQHSLYLFGFYVTAALSVVALRVAENKVANEPAVEPEPEPTRRVRRNRYAHARR